MSKSRVDVQFKQFKARCPVSATFAVTCGLHTDAFAVQIGGLIPVTAPESAKGWLDTTYLDEELRISRGDKGGPACCMHTA